MDLRHLRYFIAIADSATMMAAADKVFVTQSTLSHQLAQLETELGVKLFERIGRGLRLSDSGKEYLGYARGILRQVEEGKQALSDLRSVATGSLRIGVIHSFVTHVMPQVSAQFLKKHPHVQLKVHELTALDIEAQVEAGELDVGFAFSPPSGIATRQITGEHLFDDVLALAVPKKHILTRRKSVSFKQLKDVPLAMMSQRFATRRLLDGHFVKAGVSPSIVIEIDSVDALQRLVELEVACAFLPVRTTQSNRLFSLIEVVDPKPMRGAGLVWRNSNYRSAASLAFASELRSYVQVRRDVQ
jgi:LysR family transcriptional regulator, cyn operon transcriptional activator